jgi:hypothetical protein
LTIQSGFWMLRMRQYSLRARLWRINDNIADEGAHVLFIT